MTPSRRAAESATSPLLTKAAEEAAREIAKECRLTPVGEFLAKAIINQHLDFVQKEMKEAREIIDGLSYHSIDISGCCSADCFGCKAQAWLARNPEGVGA